jgi:hypothetical protein
MSVTASRVATTLWKIFRDSLEVIVRFAVKDKKSFSERRQWDDEYSPWALPLTVTGNAQKRPRDCAGAINYT